MGKSRPLCIALLLATASCSFVGGDIQRVMDAYQSARFQKATQLCDELAERQGEMNPKGMVRYLAFCGLAHYRLGDRDTAGSLLARAEQLYRLGDPRWLHAHVAYDVNAALGSLRGVAPVGVRPGS